MIETNDLTTKSRRAFSLIELMIAIVILGLGMVLVATMFPVAWSRARRLTEQTREVAVSQAASTTMQLLARVDGLNTEGSAFEGDMLFNNNVMPKELWTYSDTRVHYLHMENLRIEMRGFVPDRSTPWSSWAPWRLTPYESASPRALAPSFPTDLAGDECESTDPSPFCFNSFITPQVRFEQRIYPPLRPRMAEATKHTGEFDPMIQDRQWDDALDTRRFVWGVFHRLRERFDPATYSSGDPEQQAIAHADDARKIDLYYVTLRRTEATQRFARQDDNPEYLPSPFLLEPVASKFPRPLSPDQDVVLPEPWRVQIQLQKNSMAFAAASSGIPTVVQVPPDGAPANVAVMLVQMFQRGSQFIDEESGQVYRVADVRLSGAGDKAYLTLDREITVEDVNRPAFENAAGDPYCAPCNVDRLDDEELLRTVWIFPPPVLPGEVGTGVRYFDGLQPVVGIQIQQLTIVPTAGSL